jgi:hypothetical protein
MSLSPTPLSPGKWTLGRKGREGLKLFNYSEINFENNLGWTVANSDLVNSAKEPFKMEDDQYLSDK